MRWGISAFVLASLTLILGCRLGPDYQRPQVEVPADWRWKQAEPRDQAPRGEWWKVFQQEQLTALIEQAAATNAGLQAAFARVEQARAAARIDRSSFYPLLQSGPSFVRYRTSGNAPSPVPFPVPSFTQQQWAIPFDLSYEVDLWGRLSRTFESSRNLAVAAEAARQSVLLTLQADVAVNYFTLQMLEQEVKLLQDAINLRKEAFAIFEQRLSAGVGSSFEVERARVEVATAEGDLQAALRRRAERINALAVLCGKAPVNFDVAVSNQVVSIPEIAPNLPSSLLERRPDIAQAEREMAARSALIGATKAAYFPRLNLTASGGVLSGELSDIFEWDSHTWSIGPSLSIPLFQGGRSKSANERALAAYEEAVANYRDRILVAFREVEDSLVAIDRLRLEGQARRAAADSATRAAGLSIERYRAGTINFLEVVDAENVRLLNEIAALRAHNEQLLATVRLIKALGGAW